MNVNHTKNYRKTKKGLVTNLYHKMKQRNTVDFELSFLHTFCQCKKFDRLFAEWVRSNYHKDFKPTIDRISNKKGYTVRNIQWMSWRDNRYKQTMERRRRKQKVLQTTLNGEFIKIHFSQREACKRTGLSQGNISLVLSGKRNHCNNQVFKYVSNDYIHENPELLNA